MSFNKKLVGLLAVLVLLVIGEVLVRKPASTPFLETPANMNKPQQPQADTHPLQIAEMRKKEYPGSEVNGETPTGGWPAVIFNHGYIPPTEYTTIGRYAAYTDAFSRNDYIVFKPDYRGHGNSEGNPEGAYYSPSYTTDVLNVVSSIKKYPGVNPDKIGMWGHSMGGNITLRSMVVTKDIKVGVIWAGVVASYQDMINNWRRRIPFRLSPEEQQSRRPSRQNLIDKYGRPEDNPDFWNSISPINFVSDISGPVQIHHGTEDESVPPEFSESLKKAFDEAGKPVEYYTYPGADHNLSGSAFDPAIQRSVEFFDKYLK